LGYGGITLRVIPQRVHTPIRCHSLRKGILKNKINELMTNTIFNKLSKKDYLKIILFVVTFLVFRTIFSDWEDFKAGLFGF
jgi:hypothetical protein